jgi:hypothetical protein
MTDDWRLTPANETLFLPAKFVRKPYTRWSSTWEHDHCSFCMREFAERGAATHEPGTVHEGYSTAGPPASPKDNYYWVCADCFGEFRERLGWTVRSESSE